MRKILTIISIMLAGAASATAQDTRMSYINLPIHINLAAVQQKANEKIPARIVSINENNMVCVEAKKAKYEYPCFRGWKWYSCDGWTYISPEIKCDVSGAVDKVGDLQVGGEGGTLKMSIPIHAQVTAEAGVRETAEAGAIIKVSATPGIDADWNLTLAVTPDFEWTQRPELMLFNLIKITIGSKVEPELRKHMDTLVAELPATLQELKVRDKVAEGWADIQNPIKLSDAPETYVLFKPAAVGFSGISIVSNILKANVSVSGETRVVVGPLPVVEKVPLAPLTAVPLEPGAFSLDVPAAAKFSTLLATVQQAYPSGYTLDTNSEAFPGKLHLQRPGIQATDDGKLRLSVVLSYDNRADWLKAIDVFGWFDVEGIAYFDAKPIIDEAGRSVRLEGVAFDALTSSGLVNSLVDLAQTPPILAFVESAGKYDFGPDLDKVLAEANKAINIQYDVATITGSIDRASLHDLVVGPDAISVTARAEGSLQVDIGL